MSVTTQSEAARIAGQLRRAFDGEAWHGDSLFEILEGVAAGMRAGLPLVDFPPAAQPSHVGVVVGELRERCVHAESGQRSRAGDVKRGSPGERRRRSFAQVLFGQNHLVETGPIEGRQALR